MAAGIVFQDGQSCLIKRRHVKYNFHLKEKLSRLESETKARVEKLEAMIFKNKSVRLKKTRILVRSPRAEALRTIQYLIPAGSEHVRMVRKFQNCMQNTRS